MKVNELIKTMSVNQLIYIEDLFDDFMFFKGTVRDFKELNPSYETTATMDVKCICTGASSLLDPNGIVIYI